MFTTSLFSIIHYAVPTAYLQFYLDGEARNIVNETVAVKTKKERKYKNFLKSIIALLVLMIDEMDYFNISKEEANHFFQITSKCYEKNSTIFTSRFTYLQEIKS